MIRAAALFLLLALPAAARRDVTLEKVRSWAVYDPRDSGTIDFRELCRLARLPCSAIVARGERLEAPAGPIAGRNVGELLDRVLAAHPGHRASFDDGVLSIKASGACETALSKPLPPRTAFPPRTARVAAWLTLRKAGWKAEADRAMMSLGGERDDARFLNVELVVGRGVTVGGAVDAVARGDGRMVWFAEQDAKGCSGFRIDSWREPQGLDGPSILVSVGR